MTNEGRLASLAKKYKTSVTIVTELWERCGGRCFICDRRIQLCYTTQSKRLVACLDHDHNTGKLRSFLCSNCNTALGFLKDDKRLFMRAIHYLNSSFDEIQDRHKFVNMILSLSEEDQKTVISELSKKLNSDSS